MVLSVDDKKRLIKGAFDGKRNTYSPYSHFPVGAALLTPTGQIITGTNVENASIGGTICAERTAVVKAVSEGNKEFIGLAVTSNLKELCYPCGICRQVLREFCAKDMPILLVPGDYDDAKDAGSINPVLETSMDEILPNSFGPGDLELPRLPNEPSK